MNILTYTAFSSLFGERLFMPALLEVKSVIILSMVFLIEAQDNKPVPSSGAYITFAPSFFAFAVGPVIMNDSSLSYFLSITMINLSLNSLSAYANAPSSQKEPGLSTNKTIASLTSAKNSSKVNKSILVPKLFSHNFSDNTINRLSIR